MTMAPKTDRTPWATHHFEPWECFRSDRHPCKVHVAAPAECHRSQTGNPRVQGFCGVGAYGTKYGPKVLVTQYNPLPEGETWCTTCLGRAIEALGGYRRLVGLFATVMDERPRPTPPPEEP